MSGGRPTWYAFPTAKRPKVWISSKDSVRNALNAYVPYSRVGRAVKLLASCMPGALVRAVLQPASQGRERDQLAHFAAAVSHLSRSAEAVISFAERSPGPEAKFTAQVTESGRITAYAKIGATIRAAELVNREHSALRLLSAQSGLPFRVPGIRAFMQLDAMPLLLQTAAPMGCLPCSSALNSELMDAVRVLGRVHVEDRDIDFTLRSLAVMTDSQGAWTGAELRDELQRNAVLHLQEKFAVQPVRMSFSHGDFAPWNIKRMPQGGLYIFDWEYAHSAPLLNDLTHFLFMHAHLVEGLTPNAVVAALLRTLRTPLVAEFLEDAGIGPADIPAYLLLYVLGLSSQKLTPSAASDRYICDCIHHLLVGAEDARERPRVLVGAYACEPNRGSEPCVGWQMAQAISAHHEAWVITRHNNKRAIERSLPLSPNPNLHFIYVDLPRWARFWKKGDRGVRLYYYLWQLRAWWEARRLCRQVSLDIGHHVTFVNDWLYTFLELLPLPFVWGPIGSNPPVPRPLARDNFSLVRDRLRVAVQKIVRLADPLYWASVVRAGVVIGIDRTVFERLPLRLVAPQRQIVHTAIGVEALPVSLRAQSDPSIRPFIVLGVGRFVLMKNSRLAIAAFARLAAAQSRAHMIIIGDGPLKADLKEYARQLDVIDRIDFRDWVPRDVVLETMRQADVFLFPSTEGGGMVVLEALASGLPVVCLDYGGPGSMVTDGCGVRVTPDQFAVCAEALGDALRRYSSDSDLLMQHRRNAVEHANSHYGWQDRSVVIQRWYRAVLRYS